MASRSLNKVFLIGNLTKDPELRYTPSGTPVCSLGLATNRSFVTDGDRREETEFHKLVAWNKLAELCSQLLKKGIKIHIEGRLQTRSWQTPDGQNRQTTEIVVEDMMILTPKGYSSEHIDMPDDSSHQTEQYQSAHSSPEPNGSGTAQDDVAMAIEEEPKEKKGAAKKETKEPKKEEPKAKEESADEDLDDLDIPF